MRLRLTRAPWYFHRDSLQSDDSRRVAKLHLRAQLREFFSSTPCAGHAILNCVAFDAQLDIIPPLGCRAKAGFNVCHPLYLVSKPWRNSASPRIRQLSFHRPARSGKWKAKQNVLHSVMVRERTAERLATRKFKTYGRIHSIYPGGIFSVRPHPRIHRTTRVHMPPDIG
ncbi:hypothetical protein BSL78_16703 [Apostichopus japonicus]|uniref:Uncharacterized protein n=1 Tax=Stichopus japonicus TaxID=307972 RepID=A0A2G8KEM6_STIJA|nr:hypothetical protein BSL78_16703 [Apostichopus japonicus]